MPTLNQLTKRPRKKRKNRSKSPDLQGCPVKLGTIVKVTVRKPKKPNSANRCVCRVKLTNGRTVSAYIPGERNKFAEHQRVLVRGGRVKDLPGVRYHVVRGAADDEGAEGPTNTVKTKEVFRRKSRSKYGVSK